MHTICTALSTMEHSISKFENAIEECHILEDEAHLVEEEETSQDQPDPEGEIADVEMVNQEERGDPESSGPQVEADTEDHPPQASEGDVMSPKGSPAPEVRQLVSLGDGRASACIPSPAGDGGGRGHIGLHPSQRNTGVLCVSTLSPGKNEVGADNRR